MLRKKMKVKEYNDYLQNKAKEPVVVHKIVTVIERDWVYTLLSPAIVSSLLLGLFICLLLIFEESIISTPNIIYLSTIPSVSFFYLIAVSWNDDEATHKVEVVKHDIKRG